MCLKPYQEESGSQQGKAIVVVVRLVDHPSIHWIYLSARQLARSSRKNELIAFASILLAAA